MRTRLSILLILLIAPLFDSGAKEAIPKAIKGVIDLREIGNVNSFIVKLNGEWEFYWKKMISILIQNCRVTLFFYYFLNEDTDN